MKRENRRIAAMSWAGDDDGPPKPPKPMTDSTSKLFQLTDVDENAENGAGPTMTYIIAQNPQVLAKLMRENERRMVNPSSYTTPASVFNVLAVDFQGETTENKPVEEIPLKTVQMPATDLIPLKQENIDIVDPSLVPQTSQPSPPTLPNPEILGEAAVIYPAMSPSGLPPQVPMDNSKTRSLERNAGQSNVAPSIFARISSLERRQQIQDKNNQRSQSLIRQYSAGVQQAEMPAMRSASLERNQQMSYNFKATYSNSLDKFQNSTPPPPPYIKSMTPSAPKGGSLERSQAIIMNDLMKKYYDQKAISDAQKPRAGGSLERNSQYQQFLILQKQQLQQQLQAQQQQVQAQKRMQMQQQMKQDEPIEENIYDFGGVHVKSCASIALKKSIERGMLPPTALRTFESPTPSSSGPSSLEINRPITPQQNFRQPSPNIASRMMIFQQGTSQPVRQPLIQYQNPMIQSPFPPNQNFYIPPTQPEPMQIQMQVRTIFFVRFFKIVLLIFIC